MRLPPFMARYPMFIQSANYCFLTNNLPSRKTFFKNIKLDLSIYKHVLRKTLPIPVKWLYRGYNSFCRYD